MRHLVKGRKLGRTVSHRKATLRSLAIALIKEHRIVTTVAKAKELRTFVEPLITRAKEDTTHNRQQVFKNLRNNFAVSELFKEIGPKCKDRPGGYTRVVKMGFRPGDGAEMAVIELVDYNDVKPEQKTTKRKRTRRAGKSKKTTPASPEKAKKTPSKKDEKAEKKADEPKAEKEEAKKEEEDNK